MLIIVLVCAGLAYFGFQQIKPMIEDLQATQGIAEEFLIQISTNKLKEAYDMTSVEYQAKQNFQQFQTFVAQFPALKEQTSRQITQFNVTATGVQPQATVQGTVMNKANSSIFTVILKKNPAGQWKVDSFSLP